MEILTSEAVEPNSITFAGNCVECVRFEFSDGLKVVVNPEVSLDEASRAFFECLEPYFNTHYVKKGGG